MKRTCPTIGELLAFDAVARYKSVTEAAENLCLSVSGISKQLAGLESFVGRRLIEKRGRGIQLTTKGLEYWSKISPCLETIQRATVEVQDDYPSGNAIALAVVPTFLTRWLIPKLPDFQRLYPEAIFCFREHIGLREPFPPDVDMVIAHGLTHWPNTQRDYLAGREFVCCYSPSLIRNGHPIRMPVDVLAYPLLHLEQAALEWYRWAMRNGLNREAAIVGPRFVQYSAIIRAVQSGLGFGLVPRILIERELENGTVVEFGSCIEEDQGHYLYYRDDRSQPPICVAFCAWLREQGKSR